MIPPLPGQCLDNSFSEGISPDIQSKMMNSTEGCGQEGMFAAENVALALPALLALKSLSVKTRFLDLHILQHQSDVADIEW